MNGSFERSLPPSNGESAVPIRIMSGSVVSDELLQRYDLVWESDHGTNMAWRYADDEADESNGDSIWWQFNPDGQISDFPGTYFLSFPEPENGDNSGTGSWTVAGLDEVEDSNGASGLGGRIDWNDMPVISGRTDTIGSPDFSMWYIPNDNTRSAQYFDKNWYVVTERMLEKLQGEFPIDKALLE